MNIEETINKLAQQYYDETGMRLTDIRIGWVDVSNQCYVAFRACKVEYDFTVDRHFNPSQTPPAPNDDSGIRDTSA